MLQPYEPPQHPENQDDDPAIQCGSSGGVSLVRRNRSVSIKRHLQQLCLQEEVVLLNDSIQRHAMDLQLQEAKQRTEEQRLVLDMRTQRLLNYTHEHVSKTSNETERRMNERMIEGIQASHGRIINELQVQTRNLQQEILVNLRAEREQQLAEIESRLALQASRIQEAVNDSETRVRSDLQTPFNEWENNLEDIKSWTRAYLRTAMEAYDREKEAKYSVVTGTYIDQYLKRHDAEVASMISAQVRAERRKEQMKQDESVQACVDDAARAVEIRVDKRLVKVKQFQEQRYNELQYDITQKPQNAHLQASLAPQQSSASILQKVETIIDARLKAEVKNIMESQEQLIESTVGRKLQDLKGSTKASTACHHGCDTLQSTNNHSPPRRTAQANASSGGIQARKINTRSNRARKQAPKVAVNISRLDQVRADVINGTALRAAKRASDLEKSLKTKSKEQQCS